MSRIERPSLWAILPGRAAGSAVKRFAGDLARISALLGVALAQFSGCGRDQSPAATNVIVVLVDTLRADRLGAYGHSHPTSPVLDRFASQQAVLFSNAQSQAGCTFPSVNSILTSRYPTRFLSSENEPDFGIPQRFPTLAEILQAEGFATAAVSSSPVVRATPSALNPGAGFERGFQHFDEACELEAAGCVNRRAIALFDQLPRPFFLYLHYFDPHAPYRPPEDHAQVLVTHTSPLRFIQRGNVHPVKEILEGTRIGDLEDSDIEHLRSLYDEEIRYFDGQLGQLLEALEARALMEDTLVVVLSDHGEEILDHNEIGHCRDFAWETLLATPLVIRIPGIPPSVVEERVQNLDVMPTILDYLGLDPQRFDLEGRSLRAVLEHGQEVNRYSFAATGTTRTVSDGRFKLLLDGEQGKEHFFDLQTDPRERAELVVGVGITEERVTELRRALERWRTEVEADPEEVDRQSRAMQERLDALGYL